MQLCPHCGARMPVNSHYCGRCGQPLYGASPHELTARAGTGGEGGGPVLDPTRLAGPEVPAGAGAAYQATVPAGEAGPYEETRYGTEESTPVTESGGAFTPAPPPPPLVPEYGPLYPVYPVPEVRKRPFFRPPSRPLLVIGAVVGIAVLVLGGVLVASSLLGSQHQPRLKVSSSYHVGTLPAGATGTSLRLNGEGFAPNSQVTLYLDGGALTGNQVRTDSNGRLQANLSVTDAWKPGQHTLTAADASNNRVEQGVTVVIVPQGQAHTPGPNGAPPDDASFKVAFTVSNGSQTQSGTLTITGHPDPVGGTVCASYANGMRDDGQPHTLSGETSDGFRYQETLTANCRGTYRTGKISYEEIYSQDKVTLETLTGTVTCTAAPHTVKMEGSFVDATHVKGTFSSPLFSYSCDNGESSQVQATTGTWEGQLSS